MEFSTKSFLFQWTKTPIFKVGYLWTSFLAQIRTSEFNGDAVFNSELLTKWMESANEKFNAQTGFASTNGKSTCICFRTLLNGQFFNDDTKKNLTFCCFSNWYYYWWIFYLYKMLVWFALLRVPIFFLIWLLCLLKSIADKIFSYLAFKLFSLMSSDFFNLLSLEDCEEYPFKAYWFIFKQNKQVQNNFRLGL